MKAFKLEKKSKIELQVCSLIITKFFKKCATPKMNRKKYSIFKKKNFYGCSCHFSYRIDGAILYNKSAHTELDDAALENYLSYQ
jgi:hypothetical protein